MAHSTPLVTALGGNDTILRKTAMVLFGSLLIAAAAQVSVPMFPVPMTLQTLAILLIGLTYGSRLAAATVVTYLGQGAMGFPVFAGGAFGLVPLMGPTAGFLFGFVMMAFVAGWLVERGFARGLWLFAAALIANALLYVPGVLWLQAVTPLSLEGAFMAGAAPFLLGDLAKAAIAALIVTGALAALRSKLR